MKNKIYLLLLVVLFSSCGPAFVVWNGMDLISMSIFGLVIVILLLAVFALWADKQWRQLKDWWNNQK